MLTKFAAKEKPNFIRYYYASFLSIDDLGGFARSLLDYVVLIALLIYSVL